MLRFFLELAIGFGSMIACYMGILMTLSPWQNGDRLKGLGTLAALGLSWFVISIALT